MPPARWRWAVIWSARIPIAWSFTGRRSSAVRSIAAGPIKTAILSGIDQALWDIKGKVYGVPVYKLLGGPTRDRIRVYGQVSATNRRERDEGGAKRVTGRVQVHRRPEICGRSRGALQGSAAERQGPGVDIAIDFHGAVEPPTASLLIKALEPYQPWFYEEIVQPLNVDMMAELAKKTHIPLATGERIFTKWGFREILEKHAAMIPAAGCLLCRRNHGTAPHRGHGGGLLSADRAAQSAGAVLAGGQPAGCRVDPEFPDSGARRCGACRTFWRSRCLR